MSHTLVDVPVSQIVPGDNDRTLFDPAALAELAGSIRSDGLAQPITVRPLPPAADGAPRYQIVAGERRFRAVSSVLHWETIPAIVRPLSDEEASAIMLAENVQRVDLNPLDEARAYHKRMTQFGWSVAQAARAANVPDRRVCARLRLLDLVAEAQALIAAGQLPVIYGEIMAPLDPNRQRIALQYLTRSERPVVREFRELVNRLMLEQTQECLFDLDALIAQSVDTVAGRREHAHAIRFPVDESLPLIERSGGIAASIERYLVQLLSSPDERLSRSAPVVGRLYQGLIAAGLVYPPRTNSPLDELRPAR